MEITGVLDKIGCELSSEDNFSYKILLNNEFTGIALTVCVTEDDNYYLMAVMDSNMPGIDRGKETCRIGFLKWPCNTMIHLLLAL